MYGAVAEVIGVCGTGWSRSGPRWERGGVVDRARLAGGCSSRRQRGRAAAIVEGGEGGGREWESAGECGGDGEDFGGALRRQG